MIPFTTEFVTSAFALDGCPRWKRAEVALAGRSNVGKSSLLNALAGVKGLARTSKTPGRTRALNFFSVNDTLALCDLPGFGYAKMSHDDAAKIASMMVEYMHGPRQSRRDRDPGRLPPRSAARTNSTWQRWRLNAASK